MQIYNRWIYIICYRFAGWSDDAQDLWQEVSSRCVGHFQPRLHSAVLAADAFAVSLGSEGSAPTTAKNRTLSIMCQT